MPRKRTPQHTPPLPLTEAEKAEMEANPLPSGEAEQTPPTAAEVRANQDQAYSVLKHDPGVNKASAEQFLASQSTFMQGVLKCNTCGRTGEEDLGECPNRFLPNFTCPEPTAINPDTDVVLHSATLGVIRTVPVESLVRGRAQRYLPGCHADDCGYKVLHPKAR